ncbi:hypothetical protein [Rhizobium sp. Leaf386]|uniref:hypothetical protein n=1 Tax=Rhizobium sp. Leaf386 TaxID=1736359 RepID=UPI000712C13E|nr:hypothetical protein [Rhizobium sp. Leaf386]KQS95354.1 hypothetical protein ASG50_25345 [Rhizobium sp. Leaf386]
MTALAFDFLASHSPSLIHAKRVPAPASKRRETLAATVEFVSSNDNFTVPSQEPAGEDLSVVPSPQAMMRELGELISAGQPAKVLYPLLHADLVRHAPDMSARRVRALYNGEVSRLWNDEALAIRLALSHRRNQKARREFACAAVAMSKALAASGVPLSAEQCRVVGTLAGEEL